MIQSVTSAELEYLLFEIFIQNLVIKAFFLQRDRCMLRKVLFTFFIFLNSFFILVFYLLFVILIFYFSFFLFLFY